MTGFIVLIFLFATLICFAAYRAGRADGRIEASREYQKDLKRLEQHLREGN